MRILYMNAMSFNITSPLQSPPTLVGHLPKTIPTSTFVFRELSKPSRAVHLCIGVRHSPEHG